MIESNNIFFRPWSILVYTKAIYDIGTKILFLQYFDRLPPKYDTWCRHSIRKMISASRRIFWHSFQPSFKKTLFFGLDFYVSLGCNMQKYHFSNQNKLWNMLQAAFDHEKSFFDTPKGWKPLFQWVADVINFKVLHFSKMSNLRSLKKCKKRGLWP